ncbi:MAG TPA: phosphopantothenoylcysteine decarboxylase [bacterium]|nr:phosphopantothenoylcysteine decarboxylase [bacterium]HOL34873.1 phosphopantothenoylcysteine decarboxylase [bacterium]HPP07799.1 phosphopantothenoylcysteine decarboxylase [bacterium]
MKILITAGPTREYIDPVRFISNPATGTLGYFIAKKAKEEGHSVVIVSGPCDMPELKGVERIQIESALQMKHEVEKMFPEMDVLVMTAAVSDWRPAKKFPEKLKLKKSWTLKLVPNPDILKSVSKKKKKEQIIVGFALESNNVLENAKRKLVDKKLDILVANTVENFGKFPGRGEIFVLYSDGRIKNCTGFSKKVLASFLLKEIEQFQQRKLR